MHRGAKAPIAATSAIIRIGVLVGSGLSDIRSSGFAAD
jgi:hypothetical protein